MAKLEDKVVTEGVDNIPPATASTPTEKLQDASGEKSWGDKYKHKLHHFVRDILVNYIVNFSISALFTYAIVESGRYQNWFKPKLEKGISRLSETTHIPKEFAGVVAEFFTVTQLLLCGGHSLLPFMKWSHDNRKSQEFELGHALDELQMKLGRGDAATKQRLEEYKYVKNLFKANNPAELTGDDKKLLAKNGIDDQLQFKENRQTWKQVLKARGLGMSATTTLSFLLATGSFLGRKPDLKWLNVKKEYLQGWGHTLGDNIPLYKKITKEHINYEEGKLFPVKGYEKLGEYTILELIYTAASKLGFDHMEKRELRKQEQEERTQAEAEITRDKEFLQQSGTRKDDAEDIKTLRTTPSALSPALEARRKIMEDGGKDFRTREASKPPESSMALS